MRKRSCAVHAESFDDYCAVSIQKSKDKEAVAASPYKSLQTGSDQLKVTTDLDLRKFKREVQKADPDLWKEFDFQVKPTIQDLTELSEDMSRVSTADDLSSSCGSPLDKQSSDQGTKEAPMVSSLMIIGSMDLEIPKFIDNVFGEFQSGSHSSNQNFDLIIKEYELQGQHHKTKFWVQDTVETKHQMIIDVYYKGMNSYLFVYNSANRESYDSLVRMIEKVTRRVSKEKFTGVLIVTGGEDDGKSSIVSEEESDELIKKYGLKAKIKMDTVANEALLGIASVLNWKSVGSENKSTLSVQKCPVD